jgi:hypothetical protein
MEAEASTMAFTAGSWISGDFSLIELQNYMQAACSKA